MRVNSEFKDYYDVVMGDGQDLSLVYQRHRKEEATKSFPFVPFGNSAYHSKMSVTTHHVGFCGQVYPVLELVPQGHYWMGTKEARSHRRFCHSLADVDAFVKENFKDDDVELYFTKQYTLAWGHGERHHNFENYFKKFDEFRASTNERAKPFFQNLCPVFVATYDPVWEREKWSSKLISDGKVVYHSPLKHLEFFRVFPPYQAFQEINMWLSNQAVPMKPIPEISDEVMASIKGFDKFSFRKDPSSKKRKR